jgi:sulfatase modifying factor 1
MRCRWPTWPCLGTVMVALAVVTWLLAARNAPAQAPEATSKKLAAGTRAGQECDSNGLKMKFCWCPAGKFTMGSPKDEKGRFDDEDQISVTLSRGYWLGKFEVTQREWERLMGTTLREQRDKANKSFSLYGEGANYPMYYVNHEEATEFCRKLSDQERRAGRLPADWEYRLPTEAQWEYACRAGEKARFTFGDDESELEKYAWYLKNSDNATHEVGQNRGNSWGLHDMHGNVCEWCRDWYAKDLPGGTDSDVPEGASRRVLRGGCWSNGGKHCRSANRDWDAPGDRYDDYGFRVALVQVSR